MAGSPIWIFIEHGGSYAAPWALALWVRAKESPLVYPAHGSRQPGRGAAPQIQSLLSDGVA
jgi:hypothetical protein